MKVSGVQNHIVACHYVDSTHFTQHMILVDTIPLHILDCGMMYTDTQYIPGTQ